MADLPKKDFLRVDEVAEALGVSRQSIYLWEQNQIIKGKKEPGKPLVIERQSVILWQLKLANRRNPVS